MTRFCYILSQTGPRGHCNLFNDSLIFSHLKRRSTHWLNIVSAGFSKISNFIATILHFKEWSKEIQLMHKFSIFFLLSDTKIFCLAINILIVWCYFIMFIVKMYPQVYFNDFKTALITEYPWNLYNWSTLHIAIK